MAQVQPLKPVEYPVGISGAKGEGRIKRAAVFLAWFVTRLVIFLEINSLVEVEADIEVYFRYAGKILNGLVPFRDFALEYPPGALPAFVLPRLLAGDVLSFRRFFVAEIMIFDFIGLLLIFFYMRRNAFSDRARYIGGMAYVLIPAIIGIIAFQRFDFIPAVIVLGALVLHDRGKRVAAWALLGLGFAVKLYPVILAPIFLLAAYREKMLKKDILSGITAAVLTAAALWVPFMAAAGPKFWVFLSYHSRRGIQLESIYSVFVIIARWFGYPASTSFGFGSWNIDSSVSPLLAKGSFGVMIVLMLVVLVHAVSVSSRRGWRRSDLPRLAAMMVMAFVIGGKVLSPQYLLWVVPLLVLAPEELSPYRNWLFGFFAAIALLSYVIYPISFKSLIDLKPAASTVLILRNALLAGAFYLLLKSGRVSSETRNTRET